MKKILVLIAALATFAACSEIEQPATKPVGKTIRLKAGFADDNSRMAFAEGATTGISSTFEVDDQIYLFDAAGNMTIFDVESVDPNGVATFVGTPETAINEGDPITAVVKNGATTVSEGNVTVNLLNQTGTLANAGSHTLIYGTGNYSASDVSLTFEHLTSIVKFTLSLPASETATSVDGFYLFTVDDRSTVTDEGGDQFTYFNNVKVNALTGEVTNGKTGTGWLHWTTASEVSDHKVTLYLSLPAVNLKNAALQCTPNSDTQKRYFWNIAGSSPLTIEAGKAYSITRTQTQFAPSAAGKTFFYNDDAQVYNFGLPQGDIVTYSTSTGDWLTKETDAQGNMQIRMTANTTGSPRESTLTFKVFGAFCKYSVTQANPEDFAGDWNLNAKEFLENSSATASISSEGSGSSLRYYDANWNGAGRVTTNAKVLPVTVTYDPTATAQTARESSATLVNNAKPSSNGTVYNATRTNNLSISGIYQNLVLKSSIEIDYTAHTASYGLFLDMNAAAIQTISGGPYDGEYALFAPELYYANNGNNATSIRNKWEFGAGSLGSPNCLWWMGSMSVSGSTTTVKFGYQTQYLTTGTAYILLIAGLQIDRFYTASPGASTLIRTKSGSGSNALTNVFGYGAAYPQILQANYNNVNANGLTLTKTASVATPAPIATPAVENTNW